MTIEDIKALPIGEVAAKDSQLWLWSTNAHLHEAFHVIEAWGFRYITTAFWLKNRIGLGYWLRGKTEPLLLAVKGNPRDKMKGPHGATGFSWSTLIDERELDEGTTAVILGDNKKHSKKPEKGYEMIEALSEEPRLELFSRRQGRLSRIGWTVWGDQVASLDS